MTGNFRTWPVVLALSLLSAPLVLMYAYLIVDTVTNSPPGSFIPDELTLEHWTFLWDTPRGRPNIWRVTLNSLIFATSSCLIVLAVSSTAGYVLSRLNVPGRSFFLAGVMVLHAFPAITLIVAIFLVLQMVGLYNSLIGVILVKAAIDMPLGIWIMKGFYDTVPWEIEMAGIQDGASRFRVWRSLVLPQVRPGLLALGLFSFLLGWSEFILPQVLAPGNQVQVLSVYLASLIADDNNFDMALFKSVGLFYIAPVLILFFAFQSYLMNIYGGNERLMRILLDGFTKVFGTVSVIENMTLEIKDGEMLALLGPSGCGKSTTLFAICGIHKVTGGRILFGDRDVTRIAPQERNVGVVFQSYALYPHKNVEENIAFPLQVKGLAPAEIKRQVNEIAGLVHIEKLLGRRPAELSGGQQQRVALARALVRKPDVLLLDEPLANLDAKLRLEMRSEIRRIQLETGITAVLVTHDQVEAMSMCDRIAIMDAGKIIQIATPSEMYENPRTEFVAGFLGNPPIAFLDGIVGDSAIEVAGTGIRLSKPAGGVPARGARVVVGVRPETGPAGDVSVKGRISFVEAQGRENLYDLTLANGRVLRSIQPVRSDIGMNDEVEWFMRSDRIFIFGEDGARL